MPTTDKRTIISDLLEELSVLTGENWTYVSQATINLTGIHRKSYGLQSDGVQLATAKTLGQLLAIVAAMIHVATVAPKAQAAPEYETARDRLRAIQETRER